MSDWSHSREVRSFKQMQIKSMGSHCAKSRKWGQRKGEACKYNFSQFNLNSRLKSTGFKNIIVPTVANKSVPTRMTFKARRPMFWRLDTNVNGPPKRPIKNNQESKFSERFQRTNGLKNTKANQIQPSQIAVRMLSGRRVTMGRDELGIN